jgi:hypothetical protein
MSLKLTPKLNTHIKDPTFKQREKVKTKLDPAVKVIAKYPSGFAKLQWIYMNPLPRTSADPYLLTMLPSKQAPSILCYMSVMPTTFTSVVLFLLGLSTS